MLSLGALSDKNPLKLTKVFTATIKKKFPKLARGAT